ncbi:site-specific integrase [Vibrio owensii]|uniref:site-specific integrase n=1 Tax=Vibrio owensii TaxID=696485 RepID=UPI004067958D
MPLSSCFKKGSLFPNKSFIRSLIEKKEKDLFFIAIKQYEKDLRSDGYEEHTISAKISKITQVIELTEKQKLSDITGTEARLAREQLKLLPSNAHKMAEFKDLNLVSVIKLNRSLNKPLQSHTTIKGKLQETSTFFKYLMKNRVVQMNPFEGLKIGAVNQKANPRKPLSDEQLSELFNLKWFKTAKPKKNFQYWIPLLLRFSGCRVNEAAQLIKSDVKQIEGIWCLVIRDDKPSHRLKSKYSNRVVPIADALLQLGFLEFVNSMEDRLFPELPMSRGSYSDSVSKWAGYWTNKLSFGRGNDLHSLRHNFTNELKQAGVKEELASELVGHSREGFTYRVYGHSHLVKELHRCVNMIKTSHIQNVMTFNSVTRTKQ